MRTAGTSRNLLHSLKSGASGAMVSQLWQAATSFVLQVLAARLLGAEGLGLFALCFGVIVTATAIVSGFVGDSLTVLDRHDPRVRAGLQWWTALLTGASSTVAAAVLAAVHVLTPVGAVIFMAACALFQVEELLRRMFMARMRFWHLTVVDTTALVASVATVAVAAVTGTLSLETFLLGLAVGQAFGCLAALVMLPEDEKRLVPVRRPAVGTVAEFGLWRGAQVAINPSVLTGVRSVIVLAAGAAALGDVEAARIFVAPAILAVQGLGSYLLASYVRDKSAPLAALRARATSASLRLAIGILAAGALAALVVPFVGHLLVGSQVHVSPSAVFGWAVYAAGSATLQPYASLAAARGRQRAVFALRLVDSGVGFALLTVTLFSLGLPALVAPYSLAAGLVVGGVLVRTLVLRPMLNARAAELEPALAAAPVGQPSRPPTTPNPMIAARCGQDTKDTA